MEKIKRPWASELMRRRWALKDPTLGTNAGPVKWDEDLKTALISLCTQTPTPPWDVIVDKMGVGYQACARQARAMGINKPPSKIGLWRNRVERRKTMVSALSPLSRMLS